MTVLSVRDATGAGRSAWMQCPGCEDLHRVVLDGPNAWGWNGSLDAPTFTPSILVQGGSRGIVCHSFLTDGMWQFLTDCTHALMGQRVPMVPLPSWFLAE